MKSTPDVTTPTIVADEPSRPRATTAAPEPLLVGDATAAAMLGIGPSYFRRLLREGMIGPVPVRLGKRQLHRVDLLSEWVKSGMPSRREWIEAHTAMEGRP